MESEDDHPGARRRRHCGWPALLATLPRGHYDTGRTSTEKIVRGRTAIARELYRIRQNGWPAGSVKTLKRSPPAFKRDAPNSSARASPVSRSSTTRSR
jgi:hypothetical protein